MAIVVTEQGRVGVATGDQRGQREGGLPDPAEEVVAHGTASSPRWTRSAASLVRHSARVVRDDKSWHPGLASVASTTWKRGTATIVEDADPRERRTDSWARSSTRSATDIVPSISSKDWSIALVARSGTPRGLDDLPRRVPRLSQSQCCDRLVALTS